MDIKPIKTNADYEAALNRTEELFTSKPDTLEGDELEILVTLISAYEDIHYKIAAPDPIEAIKHVMEAQGLAPADLIDVFGTRSRVTEILNKKRKLTIRMIRKVKTTLNIPASVLIKEYDSA